MSRKKLTKKEIEKKYGKDNEKIRKKFMTEESEPEKIKKMWRVMTKKKLSKNIIRRRRKK